MDYAYFYSGFYDYDSLLNVTQSFVNVIRNSDNCNKERLLLISGMISEIDYTCNEDYKIPFDPANKIGISFHFFKPAGFTENNYKFFGSDRDYDDLNLLNLI